MVDKDYLKIAKARVHRPGTAGAPPSYRRIFIYSRNKKGKTRFSLSGGVERTLVLDPEQGTETMHHLKPYVWPITKWEDLNDAYFALKTGKLSPDTLGLGPSKVPFDIVSADGLTRMNNMALRYIGRLEQEKNLDRRPGIIDRRDYNKSGELMKQLLINFHTLPMHVVYTAQERFVATEGEDDLAESNTFFLPDLPQGVRGAVNSIVEVIGRLYSTKVEVKIKGGGTKEVTQRRLWIGLHPSFDTGFRSDFVLPDMIKNPTIPKLFSLMLTGSETGE